MTDFHKFSKLILLLAKLSNEDEELEERIYSFSEKIEASGLGEAYFGIAKSNYMRIDIIPPYTNKIDNHKWQFAAEYYDGNNAPYLVCEWYSTFDKLEELLKKTDKVLYKKYLECLESGDQHD